MFLNHQLLIATCASLSCIGCTSISSHVDLSSTTSAPSDVATITAKRGTTFPLFASWKCKIIEDDLETYKLTINPGHIKFAVSCSIFNALNAYIPNAIGILELDAMPGHVYEVGLDDDSCITLVDVTNDAILGVDCGH